MMAVRSILTAVALALLVAGFLACEGDDEPEETCTTGFSLRDGTCVGVTQSTLCADEYCTGAGVSCVKTYYVKAGSKGSGTKSAPFGQIADAASKAGGGDCIAVAAGTYAGNINLYGGVSLLGAGADQVTIKSSKAGYPAMVIQGGKGGLLRGFQIEGDGRGLAIQTYGAIVRQARLKGLREVALEVQASGGVVLEHLEVLDTRVHPTAKDKENNPLYGVGIQLGATEIKDSTGTVTGYKDGSTATIRDSALSGNKAQGVLVHMSGLTLQGSLVQKSGHYGVTAQCRFGASISTLPLSLDGVTLKGNAEVGLLVAGCKATVKGSDVLGTTSTDDDARGIEIQESSEVVVGTSNIESSQGVGMLLDGGETTRSLEVKVTWCTVNGNDDRGILVQKQDQGKVQLESNTITNNRFTGIGVNDATGVTIKDGLVKDTRTKTLMTPTSSITTADGIQVLNGADAAIASVTVEANDRLGLLFDAAKGSLTGLTISNNKEQALISQNGAKVSAASVTDGGGNKVSPTTPPTDYVLSNELIESTPVPVPTP